MPSPGDVYVQGIFDRFSYFASWLPNANITLGDVGTKNGKYFQRLTSLTQLGIPFKVRKGTQPTDFDYAYRSTINAQARASGGVSVGTPGSLAEGSMEIEFGQEGAFLFEADHCLIDEIEDKVTLGRTILNLYQNDAWDGNWVVVHSLVTAQNTTIFVANSRNARLELSAKVPLSLGNLANPSAGLTIRAQSGDVTRFVAEKGLTPMFKLSNIDRSILALFKKKQITFGGKSDSDEIELPEDRDLWEIARPD
jgi:hypothetical protein